MIADESSRERLRYIRTHLQGIQAAMRDEYASQNCRLRVRKLLDQAKLLVDMELRHVGSGE